MISEEDLRLSVFAENQLKEIHLVSLMILVLAILTLITYWRVQYYEFVAYDDQLYVSQNYRIQAGINMKTIAGTFKDVHTGHWHPLTTLSHMVDWQMFRNNAGGHHWTNLIIHVFNTTLLFLLFWMMTGAMWRSALVAALFAIHPINVESVAWISERKNVLYAFFWFLTMIFYVWYVRSPGWKRYLPVLICFVLGLMSKAMLVTLPFVLLLMDYWPLNRTMLCGEQNQNAVPVPLRKEKISFLILEKAPLFCLTAVSIVITIYAAKSANAIYSFDIMTLSQRLSNIAVSYGLYIKKLFWPTDLAVFYPYSIIPWWQISLAAILLIAATALACKYFKKYPYLFVGWFWYLGTLVPVIGLVRVGSQSMADRYVYVPFIGLFVIIAWLIPQTLLKLHNSKIYAFFIFAFFIILFTISTYIQIGMWKDTTTLFESALKINPHNFIAHTVLGSIESEKGNHEKALSYYHVSMKISPKYARTYCHAGTAYFRLGKYEEARNYYQKAIAVDDKFADAHYNLGVLNLTTNRPHEAMIHFNKALEIMPDEFKAHLNLGIMLLETGNITDAVGHFERAVELNPKNMEAQKGLMISRDMQKQLKKLP
jgi:tetratricopeptide (TPR) repeat protein